MQLTSLLGISKIVLHTIVLFFLLKIRMEPVLSLRSMIAQLAMGASDLSHRAPIRSRDEFGELARDLNSFLDRIDHVMEDLGGVLANVQVVNRRLTQVHGQMEHQFKKISTRLLTANENALRGQSIDPLLSREWLDSTRMLATALQATGRGQQLPQEFALHFEPFCETLDQVVTRAEQLAAGHNALSGDLKSTSDSLHEFRHFLEEMAVLEEKMRGIAAQGQTLLHRLRMVDEDPEGDATLSAAATP